MIQSITKCWYFDFSKDHNQLKDYCMSTKVNRLIDYIHNTSARELSHDKHQVIHIKMINMEM